MITDTIGFRTPNVTTDTMRMVAKLMEHGAELSELYMRSLVTRSFEAMRFWGAGLTHMQREGAIVWTSLTRQDRISAGYPGRDDADLINMLSAIKDALVSIIFVEQPNGNIKVSWRAQPGVDVAQVALFFGGGGHTVAAGAEVAGDLNGVQARVLKETRKILSKSALPAQL
jgi:phosphoesterase RecJ-like protein